MGFIGGVLWVERREAGGRMASRGRFWPIQWVLYPAVDSVLVVSSVGDWAAGRCVLGGIVDYVYGCGPWY
jgi:hypothetical protein